LINNDKIVPGQVSVGFASAGKANYESEYNSGLGSNGLTSARHDVLSKFYATAYPETFESTLNDEVVYIGKNKMEDPFAVTTDAGNFVTNIGKLLLSPTRTYAPLMKQILDEQFNDVYGVIHCSGGGQTKCMKYLPGNMQIIKDNLFTPPPVFDLIQQNSGADDREMYQVFNMGHRLEIFTNEAAAPQMMATAASLGIEAKIIGRVEAAAEKSLLINAKSGVIRFQY